MKILAPEAGISREYISNYIPQCSKRYYYLSMLWSHRTSQRGCYGARSTLYETFEDLCARSMYQGQGQVITSHSICGIQLLVPALHIYFWHTSFLVWYANSFYKPAVESTFVTAEMKIFIREYCSCLLEEFLKEVICALLYRIYRTKMTPWALA